MVNLTVALLGRHPKNIVNDGYWRRRQVLRMSAHFYGRSRNCFSIAIRRVQRALQNVVTGRSLRKIWTRNIWENRITAGTTELGHMPQGHPTMLEGLARSDIHLNRQSLANLAVWEPRTFKSLSKIAAVKAKEENIDPFLGPPPTGVHKLS